MRIGLKITVLALVTMGFGGAVGYLSAMGAEQPLIRIDPLPYQNFAIAAGGGIGLVVFILAFAFYYLKQRNNKGEGWNFTLILGSICGAAIGAITSYVVLVSAESYGLIGSSVGKTIFETVVPSVVGGIAGLIVAAIANEN
ncbi:hypothetical protein ABFB09_03210 [Dehalogenimonas sp. THU2]|uniref:hypothetical protein n=1 Tax=Dehalogenimonas sp. THU2 TaxID=3151121 RepID=UPI00321879E0